MNLENKNKMELLKRKNRRNNLIKELGKYIQIPDEPLFEVDTNANFCKSVFEKLNIIGDRYKIQGQNYKHMIELSKNYLIDFIGNNSFDKEFARILFYRQREIEAMKVYTKDITNNISVILEILGFLDGDADFILIDDDFNFGICIERMEYFYEFCSWGIK